MDTAEPLVTLIRKQFDGTERHQLLPPAAAVWLLLAGPDNGTIYYSGRVVWGELLDRWPMGYDLEMIYAP